MWKSKLYVSCPCKLVECRVTPCWTLLVIRISICWYNTRNTNKYLSVTHTDTGLTGLWRRLAEFTPRISLDVKLLWLLFCLDSSLARCVETDFAEAEEPAFVIWAAIEAVCAGTRELRGHWQNGKGGKHFYLGITLTFTYVTECSRDNLWLWRHRYYISSQRN